MAAYAALVSVMHIIENLQNHPRPPITINKAQTQSLTQKIAFLQDFLESYPFHGGCEELESLQSRIADAAHAAEDAIESQIIDQIYARSRGTPDGEETSSVGFYQRLQEVMKDMDLIESEVDEIRSKVGLKDQLHTIVKATVVSSRSPSKGHNIMVGFDDLVYQILGKLKGQGSDRRIIPIVGMAGIGKTTLARNVYESKLVEQHFDISSWGTLSQEYNVEDVISEILGLKNNVEDVITEILSPKNKNRATSSGMREEDLGLQLHKHLWGRRYLIIIDDMWNTDVWDKLKNFLPENNCGSRIIVTTRLSNLALELSGTRGLEMSFLDEESSWTLLSKTVFGEEGCPNDGLEEIGKKIAGNCKGLPLSIVVIGGLLAKHSSEPAYWEYVLGNLNSFVNLEEDERCYKTLHTSYDLLPTHLKPCFLYLGIYPVDRDISVSELIKLWVAEGFLKPINGKSLEVVAREYLMDLIDRNLVLVHKLGVSSGKVKSCTIHNLLRDLCMKQAQKEKFLCITTENGLISEGVTTQRRFAIHERTSTEVHNSKKVPFQYASLVRSFISFDFVEVLPLLNSKLLRVLKVFVDSEPNIYNLGAVFDDYVNSRDLDIHLSTHKFKNISFPSSVYHLWNLQTLIIRGWGSYIAAAPPEIWKMPLLKHLKLDKLCLPDPPGSDINGDGDHFALWNLQTLSTVYNLKFGEGVAKRISNIQKLKLCYEDFQWGFEVASYYFLNNLGSLHKLESLGCFLDRNRPSRGDLLQNLTFPCALRKLSLKGTWLNWEDVSTTIGPLPLLEVLKLEWHSFTGPRWETIEGQFCNLRFMLIDSSYDLKHWITESTHFPRLEHLFLRDVKCLEEIPLCIGEISTLQSIKLERCSSDGAVVSAKAIQEAQEECGDESFKVHVISRKKQYEVMKGLATANFQVELYQLPPNI